MTPAPPMPSSSSLVSLVDETPPLHRSQRKRSTPNVSHESEEKVPISVSYDVIFQKSRRSTKSKSSKSPATPKNVMSMCYNLRRSSKNANDVYGDEQGTSGTRVEQYCAKLPSTPIVKKDAWYDAEAVEKEILLGRHINCLPAECLAQIMGNVQSLRTKLSMQRVCKRMRWVVRNHRSAWHSNRRLLVRYGMDDNGQSPQWVLNGLRFMKFAQLRPILDMLLQLAPIRYLILQLFVNTIDIHSTDARRGQFEPLVDMIMDGRFERALMTTHNLELAFMGDIKQRNVSLIDKLVGAASHIVTDVHVNMSPVADFWPHVHSLWATLDKCHNLKSVQSDSVPIDPFKALAGKPLSTLVVPLCYTEGKRGAQQLAYTINSYQAEQLTCLTINGIYQDAAAVHMGRLMSIVSKPNVKAVSELFINCMVTDSPTDWLPKIPHIFTGVTHVRVRRQRHHMVDAWAVVKMCRAFIQIARKNQKEHGKDAEPTFRNITIALAAPLPYTAVALAAAFEFARVNRRVMDHSPWAGVSHCIVKITSDVCRLTVHLNRANHL